MIENYLTVEELDIIVSALRIVERRGDIWLAMDPEEDARKHATLRGSTLPCIADALKRAREARESLRNDPNFKELKLLTEQRLRRNAYDPNDPNDRHNPNHPNPRRDA